MKYRVTALVLVLLAVVAVGARQAQRRSRRNSWVRTVQVSVQLISPNPVQENVIEAWAEGLESLDAWFAAEAARLGAPLKTPLHFALVRPQRLAAAPRQPVSTGEWWDDAKSSFTLHRELERLASPLGDVRLVVALGDDAGRGEGLVEGVAEGGGDVGLVVASFQDTELTLELEALAHETLHCLGARDAYQPTGRAMDPEGLPEPLLEPRYPQRFAEVMAGEVADAPDRGHVPTSLDEVRIGAVTAATIGWGR